MQPEVAELGDRHPGQRRLVRERGRQRGVLGQPEERDELCVADHAEQVKDALARAGVPRRVIAPLYMYHPRSVTTSPQ